MPSEEQFGQRLATMMRAETADVRAAADLGARIERRHARRAVAVRTAFAIPLAVAAVAGGWVVANPARPGVSAPTVRSQEPVRTVAFVSAQTTAALADLSDYVVHTHQSTSDGGSEVWIDPATGAMRADTFVAGGIASSVAVARPADGPSVTVVDYVARTWQTYPLDQKRAGSVTVGLWLNPDSIREAVSGGSIELLGPETVNGVATLRLRVPAPPKAVPVAVDLWVDATTYLPVRLTAGSSIVDYSWLPRTPANLALVTLAPPPGFLRAG